MLGLKELTLIKRDENNGKLKAYHIRGSWQGTSAIKAAALGTAFANSITVRIPLAELDGIAIAQHDIIAIGNVDVKDRTEKQLLGELGLSAVRISSISVHDTLSAKVNHVEVVGA